MIPYVIPMCAMSGEELTAALVGKTITEIRPHKPEYGTGSWQLTLTDGTTITLNYTPTYDITITKLEP